MSYGPTSPGQERLSACHAEYLSVHPYFNPYIPTEKDPAPSIELLSPRIYPAGSRASLFDSELAIQMGYINGYYTLGNPMLKIR